jgi:hypothetical protein
LRFFTPEWHGGDMSHDEAARVPAAYQAHIASLGPLLPVDARRLVSDVSLHDGLIRHVHQQSDHADVLVRAGEVGTGYFNAHLSYGGGKISPGDGRFLKEAVGRPDVELLYDEFDWSEGADLVHRLLFWPYREVSVRFRAFALRVTAVSGRFDESAD